MEWVLFAIAVICIVFVISRMYSRRSGAVQEPMSSAPLDAAEGDGPDLGGGRSSF